jgi:hypothetical protein
MNILRFKGSPAETLRGLGRRKRGTSVLEVIFSIFLIASAALMFSAMIPPAIKSERMMANHQQATSLLQHKIDQLRGVGYGRLTYTELRDAEIIDSSPSTSPYRFTNIDRLTDYYKAATGTIVVSNFDANNRLVTLTLTWTGASHKQGNGTLTITALIAR